MRPGARFCRDHILLVALLLLLRQNIHLPLFSCTGYKLFASGSQNQPDPDQEGVVWNGSKQYYSAISSKESSRGLTSRLAGKRDILRQKTLAEPSPSGVSTLVVRGLSNSNAHIVFAKSQV